MWYHAIAHYGSKTRYWWNRTRDDLGKDVIVPFVSKQVVTASRHGVASLFNFGSAEYVTVIKTKDKLKRTDTGKTPSELSDAAFIKANEATSEFVDELKASFAPAGDRSLIQQAITPPENKIFVIMKFGDVALDSAFEGVYEPEGLAAGFEKVVRVDKIQDSGNISQQILENIATSRVIIADLTGERPNCYYEAGFAHALGKTVIFCIHQKDKVHFDLAGYRFIIWDTEASLRKQIRERLEALKDKGNS